jgi:hypothetical protein
MRKRNLYCCSMYMCVHREIIMRIRSKRMMLWTFISVVRSFCLFFRRLNCNISSHLIFFFFFFFLFRCTAFRRQTDIVTGNDNVERMKNTEIKSSTNQHRIQSSRMNAFFLTATKHYTILMLLLLLLLFSLSLSLARCSCLPTRLQKHRVSIDSSQIMMTSLYYSSSSHFLSLYLFLHTAVKG